MKSLNNLKWCGIILAGLFFYFKIVLCLQQKKNTMSLTKKDKKHLKRRLQTTG